MVLIDVVDAQRDCWKIGFAQVAAAENAVAAADNAPIRRKDRANRNIKNNSIKRVININAKIKTHKFIEYLGLIMNYRDREEFLSPLQIFPFRNTIYKDY